MIIFVVQVIFQLIMIKVEYWFQHDLHEETEQYFLDVFVANILKYGWKFTRSFNLNKDSEYICHTEKAFYPFFQ